MKTTTLAPTGVLLLILAFTAGPMGGTAGPSLEGPAVPRIKPIQMNGDPGAGEKVYLDRCWACHGLSGDGRGPAAGGMKPPPGDFSVAQALSDRGDGELLDVILKGKPGTAMYAQPIDPQSAVDVLAYVRGLARSPGSEKSLLEAVAGGDRESGRAIYNRTCWACHGPTGRGDGPLARALRPPPSDFTDPDRLPALTASHLHAVLTRGVPGTAMTPQALSEKEKWDVIGFLRTLVHYGEADGPTREDVPAGDARTGKEIYDKLCWACHGSRGDADGPAAASLVPPATRFSDFEAMKRRSPRRWLNAIQYGIPGTAMYPQRLSEAEARDLVAYLRTLGRKPKDSP